jgi:hypothetical protein
MTSLLTVSTRGRGRHVLHFKRTTSNTLDEARGQLRVNCVDSPPFSSLNCLRSVSKDPPIPIMTVLPRNELVSLSGQSTTAPTADGEGPLEKRPSAGIGGGRSQRKSVNGIGPSFCATSSCDHAHAPSQPEQFQQGNRPTNEYVLVSVADCNDPTVGAVGNDYNAFLTRSIRFRTQNVAFVTFLGFTILQNVFAFAAHSQSMMADCAGTLCCVLLSRR